MPPLTRRPQILLALALVAASLLGTAPSLADAAPRRAFYGVQVPVPMSEADVTRMRGARVGTVRLDFRWSQVQPQRGGRHIWDTYDIAVARAARARVSVLAHLIGSPSWAASKYTYPPRTYAARRSFAYFVSEAVRRYGPRGSFWRENPGVPYRPVRAWQPWNEVNWRRYWGSRPSARGYASLLVLASRAIRTVDRRATVVLAGLPEGRRAVRAHRYLAALYRVRPSIKRHFSAVALHPYARDHRGVLGGVIRARKVMRRYRDSRTSVWITEFGWATMRFNAFVATTRRGQARKLAATYRTLARYRRRYRITRAIWFNWSDVPPYNWWDLRSGLFDRYDNPKPSWFAFKRLTKRSSG